MFKTLDKKLNTYFSLIPDQVKLDPTVVTYDKGFYYSKSKVLSDFEDKFIKLASENFKSLLNRLKNTLDQKQKINTIHLLGWYQKPAETYQILKQYILDPEQEVRNAAARATFPQVASGIVKPDPDIYFTLLHMPSDYDKNKALGTILRSNLKDQIPKDDTKFIIELTIHPLLMVNIPAKKIIEKINPIYSKSSV